ncbi:MAG: helix-turn-helix domain-containing protein [Pseudonocardiaceae bacterium]
MAVRRQKLSQRRKAVGLTQESLAEHLGVERSTVIRWEAGESQPLPSIRPNLARALHVSIDQLAELLTQSDVAGTTRTASAAPEVTAPVPSPEVSSQRTPSAPEFDGLVHSQVAETVEALRRALHSAGVSAEDLAAMLLVGGSSRVPLAGSDVPAPRHTEALNPSAPTTITPTTEAADLQRRRAGSRRCRRLAAVALFVLGLPATWLSAPIVISDGGTNPQAGARTSAVPVVAIPAPNPGSSSGRANAAADTAPIVIPAPPPIAAVPVSQTSRAADTSRTASRSTRPAAKTRLPSSRPPEWVLPAGERWDISQLERIGQLW